MSQLYLLQVNTDKSHDLVPFPGGLSISFKNSCICEYKIQHAQRSQRWLLNGLSVNHHVGKTCLLQVQELLMYKWKVQPLVNQNCLAMLSIDHLILLTSQINVFLQDFDWRVTQVHMSGECFWPPLCWEWTHVEKAHAGLWLKNMQHHIMFISRNTLIFYVCLTFFSWKTSKWRTSYI